MVDQPITYFRSETTTDSSFKSQKNMDLKVLKILTIPRYVSETVAIPLNRMDSNVGDTEYII